MNRHRAKVSRRAKAIAAKIDAFARVDWATNVAPECANCQSQRCQDCNAWRWHDESVEQEFYWLIEKYSPLVQERAGKLCGFKAFGPLTPQS